ncbi:DUF488 family protein [Nocardia sp. NPDC058705]|uniref:DUF488 family protein n=1 Tax=Nocardia sp. NPDC058705 TaxID=3346609 RepID=UPI0036A13843
MYTIGHSTRTADEFVGLLHDYGVTQLVDIRTVPRSRHNPQFGREKLPETLQSPIPHRRTIDLHPFHLDMHCRR